MKTLRFAVLILVVASAASADVRLPAIIGPNMVLQQRADAPIWGWDKPGQTVTILASWADKAVTATADDKGKWIARVRTPNAGAGAYTITISGSNKVRLDNVLVGEVWVCSGQSNMEMAVGDLGGGYRGVRDSEKEIADANFAGIRLFDVANAISPSPKDNCSGAWAACSPDRVKTFSAAGYFFGRELHRALNVPIGLISADWGGTVAEAWTSEDTLKSFPEFAGALDFVRSQRVGQSDPMDAWREAMKSWWVQAAEKDPGSHEHWESPSADERDWNLMEVPSTWGGALSKFDGIVWMRKAVYIRPEWEGKPLRLELGPIDDMDTTFFDGTRIGGEETPGFHDKPRSYAIPANLATAGPHTLAIRILDTGGPGGLTGDQAQNTLRPEGAAMEAALPLSGYWKFHPGAKLSDLPSMQQPQMLNANTPTALYNGMISPMIPFGIRGAIWYQGESNRGRADQYARLFPAMIGDWRTHWGQGPFPFYYVQIAPFGYGDKHDETALLREAQAKALATPNTGMAVTMDIGNPADIHPNNKQDVGRRLALWALNKTYDRSSVEYSGPVFSSMAVVGGKLRLKFDHAASLNSRGEPIRGFQIAGADKKFADAVATIEGESIVLSSDKVAAPVAARYGWGDAVQPNVFNGVNLPAGPFRTDNWKD